MTNEQIIELCEQIEGMYPTAKISFTKMQRTWAQSSVLLAFPNQRRADLLRMISNNCQELPPLPMVLGFCRKLVPAERSTCDVCRGDGYVSCDAEGEPFAWSVTAKGSDKVVAYNGTPVLYTFAMPCGACNDDSAVGGTTLAGGGA